MMLGVPSAVRIFICRGAVDLRKGFDGLSGLVTEVVDQDPQSGHLFVFFNTRRDRVKILWWDRSGYSILYKRLEMGQYKIFDRVEVAGKSFEMTGSELALILEGIDLRGARRRATWDRGGNRGIPA